MLQKRPDGVCALSGRFYSVIWHGKNYRPFCAAVCGMIVQFMHSSGGGSVAVKEAKSPGQAGGKKAVTPKRAAAPKKAAPKKSGVLAGTDESYKLKGRIYQRDDIKKKLAASSSTKPIPTIKIIEGLGFAQEEISKLVEQIVETFGGNANVSEISLTLGFNAKGAFLGIGVGGAASISVKIRVNEEKQAR